MSGQKRMQKSSSISSKRSALRSTGEIFLELEELFEELIDDHGWQWGDLLWWVFGWLKIHRPDAQEEYVAGGHPKFKYGPKKED